MFLLPSGLPVEPFKVYQLNALLLLLSNWCFLVSNHLPTCRRVHCMECVCVCLIYECRAQSGFSFSTSRAACCPRRSSRSLTLRLSDATVTLWEQKDFKRDKMCLYKTCCWMHNVSSECNIVFLKIWIAITWPELHPTSLCLQIKHWQCNLHHC